MLNDKERDHDIACIACGESVYGEYGPQNPYAKRNWRLDDDDNIEHYCVDKLAEKKQNKDIEARWASGQMCYAVGPITPMAWHATVKIMEENDETI